MSRNYNSAVQLVSIAAWARTYFARNAEPGYRKQSDIELCFLHAVADRWPEPQGFLRYRPSLAKCKVKKNIANQLCPGAFINLAGAGISKFQWCRFRRGRNACADGVRTELIACNVTVRAPEVRARAR